MCVLFNIQRQCGTGAYYSFCFDKNDKPKLNELDSISRRWSFKR